jgi:hypothetical protein
MRFPLESDEYLCADCIRKAYREVLATSATYMTALEAAREELVAKRHHLRVTKHRAEKAEQERDAAVRAIRPAYPYSPTSEEDK